MAMGPRVATPRRNPENRQITAAIASSGKTTAGVIGMLKPKISERYSENGNANLPS